jgi:3-keto-5-aminohexanoate cleavage enzyme
LTASLLQEYSKKKLLLLRSITDTKIPLNIYSSESGEAIINNTNYNKLIINFTPTGIIPTRTMTPFVPISPSDIVKEVLEARQFGISMVHLHARGKDGNPAYQKEIYARIIDSIREVDPDLVLCVSTSGRFWMEFEKRSDCLRLTGNSKPDMASLTLSSLNFNTEASINSPEMIQALAKMMLENGIKPELEAFDIGMINYAKYLITKNLLKPPLYFNLILGNIACAQANLLNLGMMINELPDGSIWSAGGVGDAQLKINVTAIVNGGGVRVGLEDNLWWTPARKKLATNLDLLKRIYLIAQSMELEIATPHEVRALLELK